MDTSECFVDMESPLVLYQVNIDGCRVHPIGQGKAQPAGDGQPLLRAVTLPRPSAIAPALLSTLAPASFYLVHPWTRTTYIPVDVLSLITYIPVGNAAASLLSLITYIPVGNTALADWVRSLKLATASPAVARLAAGRFSLRCIRPYQLDRVPARISQDWPGILIHYDRYTPLIHDKDFYNMLRLREISGIAPSHTSLLYCEFRTQALTDSTGLTR